VKRWMVAGVAGLFLTLAHTSASRADSDSSCRELAACAREGRCDRRLGRCVAVRDQDCRASEGCRLGYCDARGGVCVVALPFAQATEVQFQVAPRQHAVITTTTLDASAADVWKSVQALDSLNVPRPLVMRLGLPVPTRCSLDKEALNATRICTFDQGSITQRVTVWDRPRHMVLRIEDVDLNGRFWLGFAEAEYWLETKGDKTVLTRSTTITSTLQPGIYWQPIESWMVSAEHEYLFAELRRRFAQSR
jgi:hypothetical protein